MYEGTLNEINWRTDGSSWPFSHFFMPFLGCLMMPDTWPPLLRVGIVAIFSILFELGEHLLDMPESKWDVCMDNVFAVLGSTMAVTVLIAMNIPSLHPIAMVSTKAQFFTLVIGALGVIVSTAYLFHISSLGFESVGYRKPDPEGEEGDTLYHFSWEFLAGFLIILAPVLFIVKQRGLPMKTFYVVCAVAGLLALPLAIQPEDGKNLLYTGLIGCGILACSVAYIIVRAKQNGTLPSWGDSADWARVFGITT